ncbi:MAG: transcriptional regulator [Clostridia bacterium]|nr:transcriptional regulator [Clostridia bacterium]
MKDAILIALCRTAEAIAATFGKSCETVVHDFTNADCRIVTICNGHVSGRGKESETTIYADSISSKDCRKLVFTNDYVNTTVITKDGRRIKTTSINFVGEGYHYVLGINFDTSALNAAVGVLGDLLESDEDFDITMLTDRKLSDAMDYCLSIIGKEPDKLTKSDRMQVVGMLLHSNIFTIQKAVPYVADRLRVSRYTIYNYLNQLKGKQP